MAYTFAADQDKLKDLADYLTGDASTAVNNAIEGTYSEIDSIESEGYWSGENYTNFNNGCRSYEGALKTIPDIFGCFATAFSNAAGAVEGLESEIKDALSELS